VDKKYSNLISSSAKYARNERHPVLIYLENEEEEGMDREKERVREGENTNLGGTRDKIELPMEASKVAKNSQYQLSG
jgi:hypothetical protein